jgi:chemotaxis protein MotB
VAVARPQPPIKVFMAEKNTRPIIIMKKKGGHGGHHGGAWKVAYADFVTAMMAFFMVMWLMSSSKPVQDAISGYFKDPSGTATKMGSIHTGSGENLAISKDDMPKLKEEIEKKMKELKDFDKLKNHVEITVTSEGLRIELMESASGTFFDSGRPQLNPDGSELIIQLAQELGKLPNKLSIEGHTDSKPYASSGNYGNWELSTDRANAARRLMQANGVPADQVTQVRGFADQRLRSKDPLDPSNRRVSVIVHYLPSAADEKAEKAEDEAKPGETKPGEKEGEKGGEKKPEGEAKPAPDKPAAGTEAPPKKE